MRKLIADMKFIIQQMPEVINNIRNNILEKFAGILKSALDEGLNTNE